MEDFTRKLAQIRKRHDAWHMRPGGQRRAFDLPISNGSQAANDRADLLALIAALAAVWETEGAALHEQRAKVWNEVRTLLSV